MPAAIIPAGLAGRSISANRGKTPEQDLVTEIHTQLAEPATRGVSSSRRPSDRVGLAAVNGRRPRSDPAVAFIPKHYSMGVGDHLGRLLVRQEYVCLLFALYDELADQAAGRA